MKSKLMAIAFALSGLASLVSGCSVKDRAVVNQPPNFDSVKPFSSPEFGTITPKSITLFYWPEGLDEEGMRQMAKSVRTLASRLEELDLKGKTMQAEMEGLQVAFETGSCLDFAARKKEENGVTWVKRWKEIEPVDAVPEVPENDPAYPAYAKYKEYLKAKAALDSCKANQTRRETLIADLEPIAAEAREKTGELVKTIDRTPDEHNWKSASTDGSQIVLSRSEAGIEVQMSLKDFMVAGYSPSNISVQSGPVVNNANYDADRLLLTFDVPEVDENGKFTGAWVKCALERGPDVGGLARFSGDMKLVKDGKVLRFGSITITGAIK